MNTRRRIHKLLLLGLLASLFSACANSEVEEDWLATTTLDDIQLVDPAGTVNMGFPMLFDGQGESHIAYLRSGKRSVLYAHRSGDVWSTETVVQDGDFSNGLAVGLNGSHEPVITYQRMVSGLAANLEISERVDGVWSADTIDTDGWVGSQSSIQVFPSGSIRLAYFAGYPYYDLRYAERKAGEWVTTTIDSEEDAGYDPNLVSAENGEPAIVYSTLGVGLKLARRNGGNWGLQTLDGSQITGWGLAVGVDSGSLLHAFYQSDGAFKYGVQTSPDTWGYEIIERTRQTASSIVLDSSNEPWFAARNLRTLKIGTRHDGHWFVKELPEAGQIGDVTMAPAPDGRLGIAYVTMGDSLFFAWLKP